MTYGMSLPKNPVIRFAPYGLLAVQAIVDGTGLLNSSASVLRCFEFMRFSFFVSSFGSMANTGQVIQLVFNDLCFLEAFKRLGRGYKPRPAQEPCL